LPEQQRITARFREQMAAVELNTINPIPAALLRRAFNGEL